MSDQIFGPLYFRARMANLWRMRHAWRIGCLEVVHSILLMTRK